MSDSQTRYKTFSNGQIEEMRAFLPDYLMNHCGVRNVNGLFSCVNLNHVHKSNTPSMQYNEKSQTVYCHGMCGRAFDIFQLVGAREGLSTFPEQLERVSQLCGMQPDGKTEYHRRETQAPRTYGKPKEITGDNVFDKVFSAYRSLFDNKAASHALEYLHGRGFDDIDIMLNGWGWVAHPSEIMGGFDYAPKNKAGYICLPHPESLGFEVVRFCTFRPCFTYDRKELKPQGAPCAMWHEYLLEVRKNDAIAITEGIFDAVALDKVFNIPAVSLNGSGNKRLFQILESMPPSARPSLLLCLDNDEAGRNATARIKEGLSALGVCVYEFPPFPEGVKDANDLLLRCGADGR